MAQVKLVVEQKGEQHNINHMVNVRVDSAYDLLKRARNLSKKYSKIFDQEEVNVFIYDEKNYMDGVPLCLFLWTPQEIYKEKGIEGIAKIVENAQDIKLLPV